MHVLQLHTHTYTHIHSTMHTFSQSLDRTLFIHLYIKLTECLVCTVSVMLWVDDSKTSDNTHRYTGLNAWTYSHRATSPSHILIRINRLKTTLFPHSVSIPSLLLVHCSLLLQVLPTKALIWLAGVPVCLFEFLFCLAVTWWREGGSISVQMEEENGIDFDNRNLSPMLMFHKSCFTNTLSFSHAIRYVSVNVGLQLWLLFQRGAYRQWQCRENIITGYLLSNGS